MQESGEVLKKMAEKIDDDFMLAEDPASLNVKLESFYMLVNELKAAMYPRVIYDEDQLKMAHQTINQMRLGVDRALTMLEVIRGPEF